MVHLEECFINAGFEVVEGKRIIKDEMVVNIISPHILTSEVFKKEHRTELTKIFSNNAYGDIVLILFEENSVSIHSPSNELIRTFSALLEIPGFELDSAGFMSFGILNGVRYRIKKVEEGKLYLNYYDGKYFEVNSKNVHAFSKKVNTLLRVVNDATLEVYRIIRTETKMDVFEAPSKGITMLRENYNLTVFERSDNLFVVNLFSDFKQRALAQGVDYAGLRKFIIARSVERFKEDRLANLVKHF